MTGAWAPSRRLLTGGLIGLVTASAFEGMAVPTVLPAVADELRGLELYGWAFSAFWLTNIVGITVGGSETDRSGPARPLLVGIALFAVGMVVAGIADSMQAVIAGRAIQGFGAGAVSAVVYAVIARVYPPDAQPRMIALISSAWVVPGLVGPALAGLVSDTVGWRWVFLGVVPPLLLTVVALWRPLADLGPGRSADPSRSDARRAIDAARLAVGSALLLAVPQFGNLIVGALALAGGAWLAIGALRHLVPAGTLVAARGRPAVIAAIFVIGFAFFGTEAFVPLSVVEVRGGSVTAGGVALSAAAVGWAVGGLGMGLAYAMLTLLILETATPGEEGFSSAALALMFTLGTAFGAGVGGSIVALSDAGMMALGPALGLVFGIMAAAAIGAIAIAWRVPRSGPSAGRGSNLPPAGLPLEHP